jgi:hypothetical protein
VRRVDIASFRRAIAEWPSEKEITHVRRVQKH